MLKNEKGISYVNWAIIILIALIFTTLIIRVLVSENELIQQKREEEARNKTEKNITIELTNETQYN